MSDLIQRENQYTSYIGWYGVFGEECESAEIDQWGEIYVVYEIDSSEIKSYQKNL